jgi:uncharacterized membrane-anchored protein
MLNLKVWAVSAACFLAVSYTLCVTGGLLLPGLPIAHRTLELVVPGFMWISASAFVLGLVETFLFGLYGGFAFALLHNLFAARWGTAGRLTSRAKAA